MKQDDGQQEYDIEGASKHVARTLMYVTAKRSVEAIDRFLTWLLIGAGATFGLVISNLNNLSDYLALSNVRFGAYIFLAGALLTVIEKYIASIVIAAADAVDVAQKQSEETYSRFPDLRMDVLKGEFESVTLPTTRLLNKLFNWLFPSPHPAHNAAKAAQIASQIGLLAIILILISVAIIAFGLQI